MPPVATKLTPVETIALAREVGLREAARRTGYSKSTVSRWIHDGPPQTWPPRNAPKNRGGGTPGNGASNARGKGTMGGGEGTQTAQPGAGLPRAGEPGTVPHPPGWRPTWMRKEEREALAANPPPPAPPRLTRVPEPHEVPQDARLSEQQNIALHLLICGYHHGEICAAMGISEWEIIAWRRDPTFRALHRAGLDDVRALAEESGTAWGAAALAELYGIGMDRAQPAPTREAALRSYLDRTGWAKSKRVEAKGSGTTVGLPGVPSERLDEEEAKAREELRLLDGGKR